MYNQSQNPQVALSLTDLSEALYRLMERTPPEDVAVSDLCREAGVTRRTYYRNCAGMADLVDYAIETRVRALLAAMAWDSEDTGVLYESFFRFWYENRAFLAVTHRWGLFPRFAFLFIRECTRENDSGPIGRRMEEKCGWGPLRQFRRSFLVGGLCQMLEQWTREDFATPLAAVVSVPLALSPNLRRPCGETPPPPAHR